MRKWQRSYALDCAKIIDLQQQQKMRALPSTRPVEAKRGQSTLTPIIPFRQTFFDEENVVFGKICYFMIFQEKVSDSNLYQCYASNTCVTNTSAES